MGPLLILLGWGGHGARVCAQRGNAGHAARARGRSALVSRVRHPLHYMRALPNLSIAPCLISSPWEGVLKGLLKKIEFFSRP